MECNLPTTTEFGQANGKPLHCPLVYCPPRPDDQAAGNLTYSICVEYPDSNDYLNELFCATSRELCHLKCDISMGDKGAFLLFQKPDNLFWIRRDRPAYYTFGCLEGDYTHSESYTLKHYGTTLVTFSHEAKNTTSIMPWIVSLIFLLIIIYNIVAKKWNNYKRTPTDATLAI